MAAITSKPGAITHVPDRRCSSGYLYPEGRLRDLYAPPRTPHIHSLLHTFTTAHSHPSPLLLQSSPPPTSSPSVPSPPPPMSLVAAHGAQATARCAAHSPSTTYRAPTTNAPICSFLSRRRRAALATARRRHAAAADHEARPHYAPRRYIHHCTHRYARRANRWLYSRSARSVWRPRRPGTAARRGVSAAYPRHATVITAA